MSPHPNTGLGYLQTWLLELSPLWPPCIHPPTTNDCSPLCCKAHQKFVSTWSCHLRPSWTTLASRAGPHKFQNLFAHVPSSYKLLPPMSPHLLHLGPLSNPDDLYDLHLKLILLSHYLLENLETVLLH